MTVATLGMFTDVGLSHPRKSAVFSDNLRTILGGALDPEVGDGKTRLYGHPSLERRIALDASSSASSLVHALMVAMALASSSIGKTGDTEVPPALALL